MTRRNQLVGIKESRSRHAGLWLEKYTQNAALKATRGDQSERVALMGEITKIEVPKHYSAFHANWLRTLGSLGAQTQYAATLGSTRLTIGLGNDSVLETSITLHRTWGVPYIPGSALKGLASSYAHQRLGGDWCKGQALHLEFFGDTTQGGAVIFHDALPDPQHPYQLHSDVLTPHHSKYYTDGSVPPADWDNPVPVAFLSAQGTFTVALAISSRHVKNPERVLSLTFEILKKALLELGIGAKTSSGYGQLVLCDSEADLKLCNNKLLETDLNVDKAEAEAVALYEVTEWNPVRNSGFLTGPDQQRIYVNLKDNPGLTALSVGDSVTCREVEPFAGSQYSRATDAKLVQRAEVQAALELVAVEADVAKRAAEPIVEPPPLEPVTQGRDFDAEARRLLSNAQVPPIRARFTSNPADVVSQFLTIADRCSADVSRDVALGFRALIQELGLEARVREKPWFTRLLERTGE